MKKKHESKQRILSPWMAVIIQESLENFFEFWRPTILMIETERKKKFWTQPPFAFQSLLIKLLLQIDEYAKKI